MTAHEHAASDTNVAAKNLLENLAKLRRTKISCLDEATTTDASLEVVQPESKATEVPSAPVPFRSKVAWKMASKILLGHIMAALALRPLIYEVSWACVIYLAVLVVLVNGLGAVMAAHRYYSHRSFKANLPLRIIMIISQTMCTQGSAFFWTRQHRLHHKYSDTDADPHNASRGFFFSHIGWLFVSRHPLVTEKYKEVNTSDLEADPIVMFQKRHYWEMMFFFGMFLPTLVPVYFFGDTWWNSYIVCVWLRIVLVNHATFSINSWAHLYGTRPYDKNIQPVETVWVSIFSSGDGWHNYHHTFPWDYRASEYGAPFNLAARLIEMFAYIGWATDLKVVTPEMVASRVARTGDGSLKLS